LVNHILIGVLLSLALLAQSADPPLVLRSETRAVEIDVVARDKAGDPIRDLRSSNFTIFDDGKPRPIQFFSTDVDSAQATPTKTLGRVTAIVLDGLNTEFSDQSYARDQAIEAVGRIELDESIAILALTPGLKLQDFTRNRQLLLAAIDGFHPNLPPYAMKQRIQVTLAALKTLADHMSRGTGRKSIVWITGGFPQIQAYDHAFENVLRKLNESNVAVYPVDARGLMLGFGAGNLQTLDRFAESTGGRAFYNGNGVATAIESAIEDSKSIYVMGFYLGEHDRDRGFHELKVQVDRPGAILRYRRGYSPGHASQY
jgi:VWFA-related protein